MADEQRRILFDALTLCLGSLSEEVAPLLLLSSPRRADGHTRAETQVGRQTKRTRVRQAGG